MKRIGVAVCAALVIAGCDSGARVDPTPTSTCLTDPCPDPTTPGPTQTPTPMPTPSATPTPTSEGIDTAAVAEDGEVTIREAQAVLDAGNDIYWPALITWLQARQAGDPPGPTDEVLAAATLVFVDDQAEEKVRQLESGSAEDLDRIYPDTSSLEPVEDQVQRVVDATANCIYVESLRDRRGMVPSAEVEPYFIALVAGDVPGSSVGWRRVFESLTAPEGVDCTEIPGLA